MTKKKLFFALSSLLSFVGVSIAETVGNELDLLIIESSDVFKISTSLSNTSSNFKTSVAKNFNGPITDADYHFSKNLIFWIDANSTQILSRNLDPKSPTGIRLIVDHTGVWEPSALAVDHTSDQIYVVDTLGRKIDAYDLDGEKHVIVVAEDLERPTRIALDPYAALMFVVDSDRIIQINMDGRMVRSVIQKTIEFSIIAITLDSSTKTIYWWDSDLNSIESSSYIGEFRKVIHHHGTESGAEQITSLLFFNRYLYYADRASKSIWKIDINANTLNKSVKKVFDNVNATSIRVIDSSSVQHVTEAQPCNNSKCEHACLLSSAADYMCKCSPGYLIFDKTNCIKARDLLLYSQKEVVKARELYPSSSNGVVMSIAMERGQSLSVDFDYNRGEIYFSDASSKKIYRSNVMSGKTEEITSYEGSAKIAVDWVARNLYYTDYVEGTLNVVSLRNNKYKKVLLDNITGPKDIIVHPKRAQIFFYTDGKIKRMNTDGKKLVTIHEPILHKTLKLALDIIEERLYWVINDLEQISSNSTIQHSNLNGTDIRTVNVRFLRDCSSFAVHEDWIYVVAENFEKLLRIDKRTGKGMIEIMPRDRQGFYAIAVYSPDRQASWKEDHPCAKVNGKCEKLCYAVPWTKNRNKSKNRSLMHVCDCPSDEYLAKDRRSCKNGKIIKEKQLVHRCEADWEFTCRNGRCIPKTQICDGVNDCLDRSDENNCPVYTDFFHNSR